MAIDRILEQKSAHRSAFDHYLRTGQRLTTTEWLKRTERKFNPYHDEIGRFTSPPGVTVSWGATQPAQATRTNKRRGRSGVKRPSSNSGKVQEIQSRERAIDAPKRPRVLDGLTTEVVRDHAKPGDHASAYFDLRLRQADLDAFRAAQINPTDAVTADLDEIQRRYDADERVLDYRYSLADQQALEIGRAGMAPVDIITGGVKIARGDAELRDYFSAGSVLPVTAIIRYVRGVPQIVGSRSFVTSIVKDLKLTGFQGHHNWAKNAMEIAGVRLPSDMVPITVMLRPDHMSTGSWGSSFDAVRYRIHQAKFLEQGKFSEAAIMDAKNIDDVAKGFYSDASEDLMRFSREVEKKIGR